ncbi:uncharacterized protein DUF2512 [Effusibacillus lacus]|nr:uncharacterized protein DUF2512 [Effusibacillus lacus]
MGAIFAVVYLFAVLSPATSVSFSYVLLTTLLIGLPFWAGDKMVLPHLQNAVASVLDGVYAFIVLWIAAMLAPLSTVTFWYLVLTSLAIAGFEYFFHPMVFNLRNYKKKGARL